MNLNELKTPSLSNFVTEMDNAISKNNESKGQWTDWNPTVFQAYDVVFYQGSEIVNILNKYYVKEPEQATIKISKEDAKELKRRAVNLANYVSKFYEAIDKETEE